jgi:hypothetical protein
MGHLRLLGEPPASDDHAALANLAFPQAGHTGFVAAAGLAGGQTIIGGIAPGEHLTLQSTVDATRGYVCAQDDLQLLSNILRGSEGANRLQLAPASPNLLFTGQTQIAGDVGIGVAPSTAYGLNLQKALAGSLAGQAIIAYCDGSGMSATATGLYGFAYQRASATLGTARGLDFQAAILASATGTGKVATGIRTGVITQPGSYSLYYLCGLQLQASLAGPAPVISSIAIDIPDYSQAGAALVCGLRIADQTQGTLRRCLEVGPATPYLRVLGGWTPTANQTPVYLSEGAVPTLRHVQWKQTQQLAPADRVMILV